MLPTRFIKLLPLLLLVSSPFAVAARQGNSVDYLAPVTPTLSRPVSELPAVRAWQPGDAIKEIPKRRKTPRTSHTQDPKNQPDPLLDIQSRVNTAKKDRLFGSALLNSNGQGYTGVNPPDTIGDVGQSHYIQMINGSSGAQFTIYNKADGSIAAGPTALETLGTGNCAYGLGDPVVLYDELADRWMMSEFSNSGNYMCVYISQTASPLGSWYAYAFAPPTFPDYPKYGVWNDAYYVSANESPSVYAFDRTAMLAGSAASMIRFTHDALAGFGFQAMTPADHDGALAPPAGTPGLFMRHRDDEVHNVGSNNATEDYLELWAFTPDFTTPANSTFTKLQDIATAEFDSSLCGLVSFNCFSQPGTTTTLDPLREVIMFRLAYRNFDSYQTLIGNFVTDVDGADTGGIRWFELRKIGASWALFQEGTYSPDSTNRWMGAIAMDGSGNIALGYNASSSSIYPSLHYAGRLNNDIYSTLPQGEHTLIVGSSKNGSNRYGDYSGMSIDPVDDCTFWFTGEYNQTTAWATRIGTFKFDSCTGSIDPPTSIACDGENVTLTDKYIPSGESVVCNGGDFSLSNLVIGGNLTINKTGQASLNPSIRTLDGGTLNIQQTPP